MFNLHRMRMTLALHDLEFTVSLGVYPEEKGAARRIGVNIELEYPLALVRALRRGGASISQVYDYAEIARVLERCATSRHWDLLEELALALHTALGDLHPGLKKRVLSVRKLGVPVEGSSAECIIH